MAKEAKSAKGRIDDDELHDSMIIITRVDCSSLSCSVASSKMMSETRAHLIPPPRLVRLHQGPFGEMSHLPCEPLFPSEAL